MVLSVHCFSTNAIPGENPLAQLGSWEQPWGLYFDLFYVTANEMTN